MVPVAVHVGSAAFEGQSSCNEKLKKKSCNNMADFVSYFLQVQSQLRVEHLHCEATTTLSELEEALTRLKRLAMTRSRSFDNSTLPCFASSGQSSMKSFENGATFIEACTSAMGCNRLTDSNDHADTTTDGPCTMLSRDERLSRRRKTWVVNADDLIISQLSRDEGYDTIVEEDVFAVDDHIDLAFV